MKTILNIAFGGLFTILLAVLISATTGVGVGAALVGSLAFDALAFVGGFSLSSILPSGSLGAIVQNPIIGQAKNQAGGMIFSNWRGLKVMRSKPLSVANPNTPAQQAVRRRTALLAQVFRGSINVIRNAFPTAPSFVPGWSRFIQLNFGAATSDNGTAAAINADNLTMAQGTMINPVDLALDSQGVNTATFSWTNNAPTSGAADSDVLFIGYVKADGTVAQMIDTGVARSAETAVVPSDASVDLDEAAIYGWFQASDDSDATDSTLIRPFTP